MLRVAGALRPEELESEVGAVRAAVVVQLSSGSEAEAELAAITRMSGVSIDFTNAIQHISRR